MTATDSPVVSAFPSADATGNVGSASGRTKQPRSPGEPPWWVGWLYLAPPLLFFSVFVLLPLGNTVRLSFFDWNGITPETWIGLENYREIYADDGLRSSFTHSLVFIIFFSFIPVTIGITVAAVLARHRLWGMSFFRLVLFLPVVVTTIVVGIAWKWMYASDGVVNEAMRTVGLDRFSRAWLGDFDWALFAIGIIGTWLLYGLTMVLFLAGIQKIDHELYDAARIDGSGAVREFMTVTLPGLRAEVAVALTITMIAALKSFDLVFATTQGGPGKSTTVPSMEIYRLAFREGRVGTAAALAVVLVVIISAVVFTINKVIRDPE